MTEEKENSLEERVEELELKGRRLRTLFLLCLLALASGIYGFIVQYMDSKLLIKGFDHEKIKK